MIIDLKKLQKLGWLKQPFDAMSIVRLEKQYKDDLYILEINEYEED